MYPLNDTQYEESTIGEITKTKDGWTILRDDGWSFFVPDNQSVKPRKGMLARFYGRGIGYTVRGLFLDKEEVFYRTEEQDQEHHEIETYGKDASEWLRRWDEGKTVWSIEMGGIGPGYEQAIQITVVEILRHLIERGYEWSHWGDKEIWGKDKNEIKEAGHKNERIKKMGLSGAQWGAAMSLALALYQNGPREVMKDERTKDRHIQVSRIFPTID